MNFIKTSDEAMANYLRRSNFQELEPQGKFYVFLNNGKMNFTEDFKKKVIITNNLNF